jgi:hypothetical protein
MPWLILLADLVALCALPLSLWAARRAMPDGTSHVRSAGWQHTGRWARSGSMVILTGIVLTPLVLLNIRLLETPLETVSYAVANNAESIQLAPVQSCPNSSDVVLTVTIRHLDFIQDTAAADVTLCVGDQALKDLRISATGVRPLAQQRTSHINKSILSATFGVTYEGSLPEVLWARPISIGSILTQTNPLSGARDPVNVGSIALPVLGNAGDYPFDSYSAAGNWFVTLPSGTTIVSGGGIRLLYVVTPTILAAPGAGNLAWRWGHVPSLGLVVQGNRDVSGKLFVCLIVVLPFLLFLGLMASVRPVVNDAGRHRFPAELLAGVGAFLLAVLPVRAVLVPSDISQLTLVDYALGTEMSIMVAASLMLLVAGSRTTRESHEGSEQESGAASEDGEEQGGN